MSGHHGLARARRSIVVGLTAALLLAVGAARAEEKEPFAVLGFGAAGEWVLNGEGGASRGLTATIEFEPIKNWLEIEAGVTGLRRRGQTEWDTDLVFKKPFDLSPQVEFNPGLGPVWMHTISGGHATDAIGAEAVLEFMFWPTEDRKLGWFVEPSYTYSFARDHEQSFGFSAGLLIPIR